MSKSAVFIIPAAKRGAANAFAASMGWQLPDAEPGVFCVPLTSNGTAVTHYACRPDLDPEHEAMLANPPPGAAAIMAVMTVDIAQNGKWGAKHFDEVIAQRGLTMWNGGE